MRHTSLSALLSERPAAVGASVGIKDETKQSETTYTSFTKDQSVGSSQSWDFSSSW